MVTVYFNVTSSGSGYTSPIYRQYGHWYADAACTLLTNSVSPIPSSAIGGFAFVGYFYNGTKYINADGTFAAQMETFDPSSSVTMEAHYERVLWTITLNDNGGSGGQGGLYYKVDGGGLYADIGLSNIATSVTPPQKSSGNFLGYYSASTGGTKYINADGLILPALSTLSLSADKQIYAQWGMLTTITLSKNGGVGGETYLYADSDSGLVYSDPELTHAVNSVTPPTKVGSSFLGYFSAASGGTKYIDASGTFTPQFPSVQSNRTMHAQWTENAKVLTLDANGGSGSPTYLFYNDGWYADDALTIPAQAITTPKLSGHTFGGFKVSSMTYIDASGTILASSISADTTATATWTAKTYTVGFDYDGGIWYPPYTTQKTVTFGQPVGDLPATDKDGYHFGGWRAFGRVFDSTTIWDIDTGAVMTAWWRTSYVGDVIDWFGLASNAIRPISSNSGDNQQRICVNHTGHWEKGVGETSGVWRNPTVTYQVVNDCTLNVSLGEAFSGAGTSGFMITSVKVETKIGQFPTVTVSGTANEGADAINIFRLSVPLLGRARAQNLLGAVQGGGQLQSCSLQASCTPVVVAENNMPCASDVVGGRLTVQATTYSPQRESAPTAGGSFTAVGIPKQCGDKDYLMWQFKAERDM